MDPLIAETPSTPTEVVTAMVEEPVTNFFSSVASKVNAIKLAINGVLVLIKTAEIINRINRYVLMGFAFYASFHLLRNYVYRPFHGLSQFVMIRSRPLEKLLITYGSGTVIVIGAT